MKYLFPIKFRILPALLCAFLFALTGALLSSALPRAVRASAEEEQTIPEAGGDLAEGSYTLDADVTVESTLRISTAVTIDLDGHTLSLEEGREGPVIFLLGGSLTLRSDASGGEIRGGNSTTGGGIYAGAPLTLSGNVKITENTGSNIYLSSNNKIALENFTGEAGISMVSPGEFTDDEIGSGTFTSDNKGYSVEENRLKIAPLAAIEVTYLKNGKVFPTTELDSLKNGLTVTGTNENGAPYIGTLNYTLSVLAEESDSETSDPETPDPDLEAEEADGEERVDKLKLGQNTILVTAMGDEGEQVAATFTVNAEKPALLSVTAEYEEQTVYFDTPLGALLPWIKVKGQFEDDIERDLLYVYSSAQYEEDYIDERYTLEGNLAVHPEGNATITVRCGTETETVSVPVSKYKLNAGDIQVRDVCMEDRSGAWRVQDRDFTPDLPEGIDVTATYAGKPLGSGMAPGVYEVELTFTVLDEDNFEPVEGTQKAKFILNRSLYAGEMAESGEYTYSFTKEGGIDPDWEIEFLDATETADPHPMGDYEVLQACEITVRKDGIVVTDTGKLRVALLLNEKLRGKTDLKLFRVLSDGTLLELEYAVEGNHILFEASDFSQTQYLIAANSEFGVYLWLTIAFGAACVIGAGVLIWYFAYKRKMKLKN